MSYAAWQSGLGIHDHLYGRASATFESAITLIEQALPFLFGKPREYLAQPLRPVFQARGGVTEFFAHQRSGFAVRQGQEKGFQQVAVGEAGGVDFHHGYIGRRALPKGLRIFVDQSQAFVCRPVTVFIEQFQLCHGIRLEEVLRLVAADLIDKGLYVLIDPEAFECVGQQRRHLPGIHVHLAQGIFVAAADTEDALAGTGRKSLHVRADTVQHGGLVPAQRLVEFGLPGAGAVVPQLWFVGVRAGGVVDAVLADDGVLADGVVFAFQG
ncbi:hypothetical protein D3C71_1301410 [compost metagenome]